VQHAVRPEHGGTEIRGRLDVSRAAQFSTGIWAAAGVSQQLTGYLGDDRPSSPRPPRLPTGSGEPAGSLVLAPPPRGTAQRRRLRDVGGELAFVGSHCRCGLVAITRVGVACAVR